MIDYTELIKELEVQAEKQKSVLLAVAADVIEKLVDDNEQLKKNKPQTGKWIDKWYCSNMSGYEYAMKCSKCDKPTYCISIVEPMPNYCPNCGADMRDSEREEM